MESNKQRVEWIDTAKGICILLVVIAHIGQYLEVNIPLQFTFGIFRMPLYFILSGLFFKTYNGLRGFLYRKINKLIVPYTFWFLFLSVFLPILIKRFLNINTWYYTDFNLSAVLYIYSEKILCNPPIWFLSCLFLVNLLFYILYIISGHFANSKMILGLTTFMLGICGLCCSYYDLNLPYYIDTAFTALPFFYFGYFLRNETNFLYIKHKKQEYILGGGFCSLFILAALTRSGSNGMMLNQFGDRLVDFIQVYPYGIIGSLMILSISRILGVIPLISYIGRYSIIILCTHVYLMQLSYAIAFHASDDLSHITAMTILLTIVSCIIAIPLCKRYLGLFTAQKDIIRV